MAFVPDEPTTGFIPDETQSGFIPDPVPERGFFGETGAALTRMFLRGAKGVTGTLVGAMREEPRYSPMATELLGVTEEEHKEIRKTLQTATEKIRTTEQKYPRTWKGKGGWALNTVAEAVGYMGMALAGGYIAGPVGAATVAFGIEGQEAYESAIKSGATEKQADTERVIVGSLNAAIEALQISKLMKFQETGKHSIIAFKNLIKKKAYKELGKAGGKFTKDVLKTAIEEGAEEFLQEGVSLTVPATLRGEYPKKADGSPDVWAIGERLGAATLGGFVAGGILGAGGAVTLAAPKLADPSVQKIENAARTIQANEELSDYEKARQIAQLREMLPEDYEFRPEVVEAEIVEEIEEVAPTIKAEERTKLEEELRNLQIEREESLKLIAESEELGAPPALVDPVKNALAEAEQRMDEIEQQLRVAEAVPVEAVPVEIEAEQPPITKEEKDALREKGFTVPQILSMSPQEARTQLAKEIEKAAPVETEVEAEQPVSVKGFEMGQKVRPKDRDNIGTIVSIDESSETANVYFYNRKEGTHATKTFPLNQLRSHAKPPPKVKQKKRAPIFEAAKEVYPEGSPFHIPEHIQKVIEIVEKFEKKLAEYEARRPELEKETAARTGEKLQRFDERLKELKDEDPIEAAIQARAEAKGHARTMFPEFQEIFPIDDIRQLQRAINESTLIGEQKQTLTEMLYSLQQGFLPHQSQIKEFDEFFGTNIVKIGKNKPKTWKQKMWAFAKIPGQTYKAIKASFDYSGAAIQGFMFATSHPVRWLKTFGPGHRAMLGKDYLRLRDIMRKSHPLYNRLRAKGQLFTEANTSVTEEEFVNSFARKIPGIGRFIAASERAHCECLNSMRDIAFDIVEQWGEDTSWAKEEELVRHISNITGRGQGDPKGWFEKHIDVWSAGFWTPRMMKGDFGAVTDILTKPHIRKTCAHDLVKSVATIATLTFLVSLIPGVDVEDDPRSSDIGKGKVGNQRFKMWGRYGQYIRLVAQLATEEAKSPQTGEIYHKEKIDIITDFLRCKLNPILSPGVDIFTGKTFEGEKMQYDSEFLSGYIAKNISPLFLKDVVEAIRFQGLNHPTPLLSVLGCYGIDMATFEADARQQTHVLKNNFAHQYFGKDWAELGPDAQSIIRARHPLIVQYEEDAKREQESFEWRGKVEQWAYDVGENVIGSLSKDIRQFYKNSGAGIPRIQQGVAYNGNWWKMSMDRFKKFQKDLKPALEKSLGVLKSRPGWNELDPIVQRTFVEEWTDETIKQVRQKMINDISMADLEAYNELTTRTVE